MQALNSKPFYFSVTPRCSHDLWSSLKPIGIQPGVNDDGEDDSSEDLALAKLMAKGELEQAKADKADDAIIQRFMMFLDDIKAKETEANASPSLAGAQASTTVAQGNAATLQAGAPPAGPPMPPGPGPGLPPGMMQ